MANEFVHKDVGSSLSEAEYDGVGAHIFNSQATGDIMYASSATQLSRLAKGTQGYPLVMGASIPQWGGAITLNGAVTGGGQNLSGIGTIGSGVITATNAGYDQIISVTTGVTAAAQHKFTTPSALVSSIGVAGAGHVQADMMFLHHNNAFRFTLSSAGTSVFQPDGTNARLTIADGTITLGADLDVIGNYISLTEMSAPGAGGANTARVYTKLVNGGKTGLYVIFQTGVEIQIAVEA